MLLVPEITRLSIDIDITGHVDENVIEKATRSSVFDHFESDIRAASKIPKKHYQFFYKSPISGKEENVLLDILEADSPYKTLVLKKIDLPIFELSQKQEIKIPSSEELLGDKLTAFAPETIGIPYHKNKSMDIIKQLFDISVLFNLINDFQLVTAANQCVFKIQNSFMDNLFQNKDVLNDTLQTSYLICQLDLRNSIENEKTEELRRGMRQINSHLLNTRFTLPEIKIAASKAAFLAAAQLSDSKFDPLELRFSSDKIESLRTETISGRYSVLNRLKSSLPEAFYYWQLISQWENEQE